MSGQGVITVVAVIVFTILSGCNVALSYHGKSEKSSRLSIDEKITEEQHECFAICRQINPEIGCDKWIIATGTECRNVVKK